MKAVLVAATLLLMTSGEAFAACPRGYVRSMCMDKTMQCCMPAGKVDCGSVGRLAGFFADSAAKCLPAPEDRPPTQRPSNEPAQGQSGFGKPSTGPRGSEAPCRSGQERNYQGECADGMR